MIFRIKLVLLAALLVVTADRAHAGSITISETTGSPAFTATKTYTIVDSDMAKFHAWTLATANAGGFAGTPAPTCTPSPCTPTPYTQAQADLAWANSIMQGTVNNVLTYMQSQASTTAIAGVASISAQ